MQKYNHKKIEAKWQKYWQRHKTFTTKDNDKRPKEYILDMFPYPSGAGLHVGHPEGYTATDILSRFKRMNGKNVLHPMGWDAFGLPAENYAIKEGVHPHITTQRNIKRFREQIKSIGLSYDWSREVDTSDPKYYKWTQWLFLQLYKNGLAYKKEAYVNWCPKDNTVLANEQVIDGKCERCGTPVVQKLLSQWFFKITKYADQLLEGLNKLDWPEPIKTMQRNWIGRSEGVTWKQKIKDLNIEVGCYDSVPQTFMAQTFCVIAPELPLVKTLISGTEHEKPVLKFLDELEARKRTDRFKIDTEVEGIFTGRYIDNPFGTGDLPIWIASFVLADYGTGIVNASAHDERDFEFAKKYSIPLRPVMFPQDPVEAEKVKNLEYCYHHDAEAVMQQPAEFKGRKWGEAREEIIDFVEKKGFGKRTVNYKLRDWLVSRQRYWGAPIPLIYCQSCAKDSKAGQTAEGAKNFVLLHGYTGAPDKAFFPWLKTELEQQGYKVQVPALPNSSSPEEAEQVDYVLKNVEFDENTVLLGHSLGGTIALKVIEKLSHKIAGLVTAGGVVSPKFKDHPRPYEKDFNWKFNYKLIKSKINFARALSDPADYAVPLKQGKEIAKKLGGTYLEVKGREAHYVSAKEPAVLEALIKTQGRVSAKAKFHGSDDKSFNPGWIPVPEKDLPVKLPTDVDFVPTGESPLKRSKQFKKVKCPVCGKPAERDFDTMDTFVDSSWYYLRYTDPKNKTKFADAKKIKKWLPVDTYVGGAEHAVLHLLYSRFFTKALRDFGMLDFDEPFLKLRNQGLILGPDGEKMSKSRGNVINPDDMVKGFGADSLRMYEMFMGPLEDQKPWQTNGVIGIRRFLDRVWAWVNEQTAISRQQSADSNQQTADSEKIERLLHKLIKKITEDIQNFHLNTAVSSFMEFHNEVKAEPVSRQTINTFLTLLYPFAPHIAEELNQIMGGKKSLQLSSWPEFNQSKVTDQTAEIVVQVNGKLKGRLTAPHGSNEEVVKNLALQLEPVKQMLVLESIKRVVYVPNKLINLVV